jgi:hypothetical protein
LLDEVKVPPDGLEFEDLVGEELSADSPPELRSGTTPPATGVVAPPLSAGTDRLFPDPTTELGVEAEPPLVPPVRAPPAPETVEEEPVIAGISDEREAKGSLASAERSGGSAERGIAAEGGGATDDRTSGEAGVKLFGSCNQRSGEGEDSAPTNDPVGSLEREATEDSLTKTRGAIVIESGWGWYPMIPPSRPLADSRVSNPSRGAPEPRNFRDARERDEGRRIAISCGSISSGEKTPSAWSRYRREFASLNRRFGAGNGRAHEQACTRNMLSKYRGVPK